MADLDYDIEGIVLDIIQRATKYHLAYIGSVVNIDDPLRKGRVLCSCYNLGWDTQDKAVWCYPRQIKQLIMPEVGDYIEIRFIAGDVNYPVWDSIATEMQGMLIKSGNTNGDVLYEKKSSKVYFKENEPNALRIETDKLIAKITEIFLGDETATEYAVLGTQLNTWLSTLVTTYNAHVHGGVLPGGSFTSPSAAPLIAPTGILSTVVKLK